jgi:hypothetical protein
MIVFASKVIGDTTNLLFAWSKIKTSLFSAPETLTSVKLPKLIFDDGATEREANVLLAGFNDTVVAGLLLMTTVVAIIL